MDVSPEAPSELAKNTCPFCGKEFRRLENHFPHCKERKGRDYSAFLAKKTLDKSMAIAIRSEAVRFVVRGQNATAGWRAWVFFTIALYSTDLVRLSRKPHLWRVAKACETNHLHGRTASCRKKTQNSFH